MKKIIAAISPYNLYLQIFQLEHYDIRRFYGWLKNNFLVRSNKNKKPLVITKKVEVINTLSLLWFGIIVFIFSLISKWTSFIFAILLITQPYILITLSIASIQPFEIWNRARTIRKTRQKITRSDHTEVIGIAGSYGKTSVKEILYHLIKANHKILKTPLSYNTIFGIAQVVDLELDNSYDYFLCELGEFQKGDIKEMCDMVLPKHGIITGINDQHLERFKNIQETVSTIFELADCLKRQGVKTVANGSNNYIQNEVQKRNPSDFSLYDGNSSDLSATDIKFTDHGTNFVLKYKGQIFPLQTPLLGYAHTDNIIGAMTLALQLGVPMGTLAKRIETLPHIKHRFDQKLLPNNILLIDNSYSSNSDSFKESLEILKGLSRKTKIFVTPGMVELGEISNSVHKDLGAMASLVCSYVILVGKSHRTTALATSINPEKIIWMEDILQLWSVIEKLGANPEETVVLLENDLPDNY